MAAAISKEIQSAKEPKRRGANRGGDLTTLISGKRLLDTVMLCQFLVISDDKLKDLLEEADEPRFPLPIAILTGKRHWTLKSIEEWVEKKEAAAKKTDKR